jgi:hypothetical protein
VTEMVLASPSAMIGVHPVGNSRMRPDLQIIDTNGIRLRVALAFRSGSKGDVAKHPRHVRFTPESEQVHCGRRLPGCRGRGYRCPRTVSRCCRYHSDISIFGLAPENNDQTSYCADHRNDRRYDGRQKSFGWFVSVDWQFSVRNYSGLKMYPVGSDRRACSQVTSIWMKRRSRSVALQMGHGLKESGS